MKIILDLNIILDVVENRQPDMEFSSAVISVVGREKIAAFIPSHGVTTIHYLATKHLNKTKAGETIDWLLERFDVLSEDRRLFIRARIQAMSDFEDAVVASLAEVNGCNYIVTRNVRDFKNSTVEAVTPEEFLEILEEMN